MKTQNNWFYILIVLLILIAGCKKPDNLPENGCENVGKTVLKVSSEIGRIVYNEDTDTHYLSYHIPRTIDAGLTGIICNLPSDFSKLKDYTEVIFSGVFKETENDSDTGIIGWDIYYLELTNIRLKED